MATITFTETVIFEVANCAECGVQFGLTESYRLRKRKDHSTFYCPNGHENYYPQETEAEKLQKELKRKEQELADVAIQNEYLKIQLSKKIKN